MVTYKKPQQRKKEESERLRGERNQIKFISLRFEKRASCRVQERKKKARSSINCTFLEWVIEICLG